MDAGALAAGKKNARRRKAWIGFADESGFSQRPPIRATWAPRGHTPRLIEPFHWSSLTALGTLLTTPDGKRLRWLLSIRRGSIRSAQVVQFLRALKRHRRRPVLLVWDRLPAHRSWMVQQVLRQQRRWLRVEWLPAYAPELNPVEQLWAYLDATALANTPVEDLDRLRRRVHGGMARLGHHSNLGRGFLRHTGVF